MRIGLIGLGIWGKKILKSLTDMGSDVVVFDIATSNKDYANSLGATYYSNFQDFLKTNVDGFILATSTSTHKDILATLNGFQKPVFVEKPLTNNYRDAQEIEALELKDAYMMHIWKYHSGVRLLAQIVQEKKLGKVLGVKSRRTNWTSPRSDTNSLWNLGIHDLSICESILGYIPEYKQVLTEKHNGVIRGAIVLMGKEPYYSFEVSNRYPDKNRDIRVFCEEGVAILKDEKVNYVSLYQGNDQSDPEKLEEEKLYFDKTLPLELELKEFIDFLEGGPPPMCSISEGFRLIKNLFEIEKLANE